MTAQMKTGKPYSYFANPYAATNEVNFSQNMVDLIIKLVSKYKHSVTSIVDIACGVGAACLAFSKQGYHVTGIDISEEMINNARAQAHTHEHEAIQWYCQDMRELRLEHKVELATCMYDSLNFIVTEQDLLQVFTNVANVLEDQGVFIFDIYTVFGLATCWGNKQEIHTNVADHFVATETYYDSAQQTAHKYFHGFTKIEKEWVRWFEDHHMRAYELGLIQKLLAQAGFKFLDIYAVDDLSLTSIHPETNRALVIARHVVA